MSKLLLCIDDDEEDLDILDEALHEISDSFTCVRAFSGREALILLQSTIPDYIFLDINMPKMNGFEVLRLIRRQPKLDKVPVIILSTAIANENELKKEGANQCMIKPPTFPALCNALRTYFKTT